MLKMTLQLKFWLCFHQITEPSYAACELCHSGKSNLCIAYRINTQAAEHVAGQLLVLNGLGSKTRPKHHALLECSWILRCLDF